MKNLKIFHISLIALALISCGSVSPSEFVADFNSFVLDVEQNWSGYQESDWTKVDKRFESYSDDEFNKYKAQLSKDQISEINNLIGKYHAIKLKAEAASFGEQLNDILDQLGGFATEVLDNISENERNK